MDNKPTPTREGILEALITARENGYTFAGWSDEQIAVDICTYDPEHEGCELSDVLTVIRDMREAGALAEFT